MDLLSFTRRGITRLAAVSLLTLGAMAPAMAGLTITPITWNVIGLDSNNPAAGPNVFPVGARVCAVGSASTGDVRADFRWEPTPIPTNVLGSASAEGACGGLDCIISRPTSLTELNLGPLAINQCRDAYFEVEVRRLNASYEKVRRFSIGAWDTTGSQAAPNVFTPRPRELYVERLISQNRNSISNSPSYEISLPVPSASDTFPAALSNASGAIAVEVGEIYDIRVNASTATQGYVSLTASIEPPDDRVNRATQSFAGGSNVC
jgi:hypothetical protein